MEWLVENWMVIVAAICIVTTAVMAVTSFVGLPTATQLEKVQEWLLWAVTQAETELGSGTGALKLRYVYDKFIVAFPWLVSFISFDSFSNMVDTALDNMKALIESNENVSVLVNGETVTEGETT